MKSRDKIFIAPNPVFDIDAFPLHDLAAGEQRSDVMAFDAFHVDLTVATRSQDMSHASGIVLSVLLPMTGESGVNLIALHTTSKPASFSP
ncbi:hypothetical protein [Rhizobium etli]|uniref:hypothetical protein n=1 Tax=Rhizobium etli TaxID=29449 RepID=UPI00093D73AB|nr:hypothetical protein [Rhizobium etli]